jgi:predicted PurR-regulated permease PerM
MIVTLFFLLRDGEAFREFLFKLSPLGEKYDRGIFLKITNAVNSVIKGSLMIAVVQGLFATAGFIVAGIPNPVVWGVVAMFSSLIPGIGTSLVTVPCIIFLYFTAPLLHTILLILWVVFGVGMIDNLLAPLVMRRGMKIHPLLILLSVLGGLTFFGPIGFIIGPVTLAFFLTLIDIYPIIISENKI